MSRRAASYADAAKLFGGESAVLTFLDRVSTVGLIVGAASGAPALLGLFDPKADILRHAQRIWSNLGEKIADAKGGRERTERLLAAHAIIAVSAYFESFDNLKLGVQIRDLKLTDREQAYLAGNEDAGSRASSLSEMLLEAEVPYPSPAFPYEVTRQALTSFYLKLSARLASFIEGLTIGSELDETKLNKLIESIKNEAPQLAIRTYDRLFLKLASEHTEFFIWSNLYDHQATREQAKRLQTETDVKLNDIYLEMSGLRSGLAAIEKVLYATYRGSASYARSSLAVKNRAELDWPLVERDSLSLEAGVKFPRVSQGYINPSCRIIQISSAKDQHLGVESWWDNVLKISDVQFPLSSLVSNVETPVVILGQPGAGKSLLTKVLSARLSESGYLSVRVELRHVSPNAGVQRQIEEALYRSTGETTSWPDLVRVNPDAPRVVLLDGLDELIQSTRTSRSDYLELVQEFQEREIGLDRPVSVIVTSRTMVANSTRFPPGSVVMRLDPFSNDQVDLWLDSWVKANSSLFSEGKIKPLTSKIALQNGDLARQPLLLLMLAIYDADDNALQRRSANLSRSDLYEQLLDRFARREVISKDSGSKMPEDRIRKAIERELHRLSVAAIAMFNRGRQWISVNELNQDLAILMPDIEQRPRDIEGFHATLTEAEVTFGRFFFVCESTSEAEQTNRTYEFLHPTFGEYLVARYVTKSLLDLDARRRFIASSIVSQSISLDVGLLFSLTAYSSLAGRAPIRGFLEQLIGSLTSDIRDSILSSLISVFESANDIQTRGDYAKYCPLRLTTATQLALFGSNLTLLIAITTMDSMPVSRLVSNRPNAIGSWRSLLQYWKSQLASLGYWRSFLESISTQKIVHPNGDRDILLSAGTEVSNGLLPSADLEPGRELRWQVDIGGSPGLTRREDEEFSWDSEISYISMSYGWKGQLREVLTGAEGIVCTLGEMIEPALSNNSEILDIYRTSDRKHLKSGVNILLSLLTASISPDEKVLEAVYSECAVFVQEADFHRNFRIMECIFDSFLRDASKTLSKDFVENWLGSLFQESISHDCITMALGVATNAFIEDPERLERISIRASTAIEYLEEE